MKVLLLGSEGTLGKSLYTYLIHKNITVIRWDIKINEQHDLRNTNSIDDILNEIDYVVFLAFDVGGSKYNVNDKTFIDNNMKIMLNTFDSLYRSDKPFIYTTSCMSKMVTNPYGSLKNISEHYVQLLKNGICVKLWNVYGDEEITEKSHVIPDFIISCLKNKTINMRTAGSDKRQFLYCNDFSEAIFIIIENHNMFLDWIKQNAVSSIDISSYNWINIYEIALLIQEIFKKEYDISIDIYNGDKQDNHTHQLEPTLSILNDFWKPTTSLHVGIHNIIKTNLYTFTTK